MDLPGITVVMTTWAPAGPEGYERSMVAKAAVQSWSTRLAYDGALNLHIADDGSDLMGYPEMVADVALGPVAHIWETVTVSRGPRVGVGASLNRGCREAFGRGNLVLYAVDDWLPIDTVYLTIWAEELEQREDVAAVRLFPHVSTRGVVETLPGQDQRGHWLRLDRHAGYAFGHRPALYHRRMFERYGEFAEGVNAYDCERLYNEKIRGTPGPDVVLALPANWHHVGGTEFAGITPGA